MTFTVFSFIVSNLFPIGEANIVEGEFDIVNETISDDLSLANSSVFVKLAARIQRNVHGFHLKTLLISFGTNER